jgi:hypothetical protein
MACNHDDAGSTKETGFLSELWRALRDGRRTRCRSSIDENEKEEMTGGPDLPQWLRLALVDHDHVKKTTTPPADTKAAAEANNLKERIPHIRQQFDWDCGIVCLQMALALCAVVSEPAVAQEEKVQSSSSPPLIPAQTSTMRNWLETNIGTRSTWTIDLVDILDGLLRNNNKDDDDDDDETQNLVASLSSFDYLFCSKQLSVNPALADISYYAHTFTVDATRVSDKYESLRTHSPHRLLQHDDLALATILSCVRHDNCVAILLVDNTIFQECTTTTIPAADDEMKRSSSSSYNEDRPYIGHYILLVRCLDDEGDQILVHDPGRPYPITVSSKVLESAWRVPGTDSDAIVLVRYADVPIEKLGACAFVA